MQFHRLALICAGVLIAAPVHAGAELLGRFLWEREEDYFGGLSGIEIAPDGFEFTVIGDGAIILTGRLEREAGRIVGIGYEPAWIGGLSMPDGTRVGATFSDSEGLALGPGGRLFVSFERAHRVWSYKDRDAPAVPLPGLPGELRFETNKGLEALALAPDGALWAIPEKPPRGSDRLPVLRLEGGSWHIAGTLPEEPDFRPVGADFDDTGRLWLLERGWGLLGFTARVRVFGAGPDGLRDARTVLQTGAGVHGNLEGLSVWRDGTGALVLTMVADDNYSRFQVTEIVEYRVTE